MLKIRSPSGVSLAGPRCRLKFIIFRQICFFQTGINLSKINLFLDDFDTNKFSGSWTLYICMTCSWTVVQNKLRVQKAAIRSINYSLNTGQSAEFYLSSDL